MNNAEVLRDVAVKGRGVALIPEFIAGEALKKGGVEGDPERLLGAAAHAVCDLPADATFVGEGQALHRFPRRALRREVDARRELNGFQDFRSVSSILSSVGLRWCAVSLSIIVPSLSSSAAGREGRGAASFSASSRVNSL